MRGDGMAGEGMFRKVVDVMDDFFQCKGRWLHALEGSHRGEHFQVQTVPLRGSNAGPPALRRSQRNTIWARKDPKRSIRIKAPRYCQGAPPRIEMVRLLVGPPGPPAHVRVTVWWPVEGPANGLDLVRHFVAEVLVGRFQCPFAEEAPHDLVRAGPANDPTVVQEHHVHPGLLVELEDIEDLDDLQKGLVAAAPLKLLPVIRQGMPDEPEVLPLEVAEHRLLQVLQPAEGPQVQVSVRRPVGPRLLRRLRRLLPPLQG